MSRTIIPLQSSGPAESKSFDLRHAEAFRELEPIICDLWRMAKINCEKVNSDDDEDGMAIFTASQLLAMTAALKDEYYRLWKG